MSEHYRPVGSLDGLKRAAGDLGPNSSPLKRETSPAPQPSPISGRGGVAEHIREKQVADTTIQQRIESLRRDLQRAEQRGDSESIQNLQAEIERMEERADTEGPHAGADAGNPAAIANAEAVLKKLRQQRSQGYPLESRERVDRQISNLEAELHKLRQQ